MGKDRIVKKSPQFLGNIGGTRNSKGQFEKGTHLDKPKGTLSLKTKVFNEILATFSEVKGKEKVKKYAKDSKTFGKYLNHIVTLVKGNDDSIGSRFTNINIIDKSGLIQQLRSEYPIRTGAEAEGVSRP